MGANVKRVKMAATGETSQMIARLTPLADVLAAIDALAKPVAATEFDVEEAAHCILAQDVSAALRPASAVALQDGFAVSAEEVADAGAYAPARLAKMPARVESGDTMPPDTDAVAPLDVVTARGGIAEAVSRGRAGGRRAAGRRRRRSIETAPSGGRACS